VAHQAGAAGAEGGAHGHFALAGSGAGQQQSRDVGAGEEEQGGAGEQREQSGAKAGAQRRRRARRIGAVFLEFDLPARVFGEAVQFASPRTIMASRNALTLSNSAWRRVMPGRRRPAISQSPQSFALWLRLRSLPATSGTRYGGAAFHRGAVDSARERADHDKGWPLRRHGAQGGWVAVKAILPELVAENGGQVAAGGPLVGAGKEAAEGGPGTEGGEVVRGDDSDAPGGCRRLRRGWRPRPLRQGRGE
jgi:hypothetical protein